MNKWEIQDGLCLELLCAQGRSDLSSWRQSLPGNVTKVFDAVSKTFVFLLSGIPSTAIRLSSPPDSNQYLGLTHQVLVLQLKIPDSKDFSFELAIADDALSRRRIQFSTFFREVQLSPDTGKLPLGAVGKGKWTNLCVPLVELVRAMWPGRMFAQLDAITVCANCSLHRIIALKTKESGLISIPPSCQLRHDLYATTQVLSWKLVSSQISRKPRTPDIGLRKRNRRIQKDLSEFELRAEGIGLFQIQPVRTGVRAQAASAPTQHTRSREKSLESIPPRKRPTSTGSIHNKYNAHRSASLPRIESGLLIGRNDDTLVNRMKEHSRKDLISTEKPPIVPRQAWRGSSALQQHRAARLIAQHQQEQFTTEIAEEETGRNDSNLDYLDSADSSHSSIDYVLSQRLAAAIHGPDETVHYSDSDTEPDKPPVSAAEVAPGVTTEKASSQYPLHSILKTSSSYRGSNPKQEFYDDSRLNALPKPALDVDEAAVLESMRKSNLELSWMKSKADGSEAGHARNLDGSLGLRRHEFDDEKDSDSEWESSIGPLNARRNGSAGPGSEMSLFSLEASGTQSLLSYRLQTSSGGFGHGQSDTGACGEVADGTRERQDGLGDESTCPVMDLMFDPDLNCYYHPQTKKYYQVASY